MVIYDLDFKLSGLKAICAGGITDDHISSLLFPAHDAGEKRSRLSRIKSGELPLSVENQNDLTEDFNARINTYVLRGNTAVGRGPIRSEDWQRPLHEFFGQLAAQIEESAPGALDRAHTGIFNALLDFTKWREHSDALLIDRYVQSERFRVPDTAAPIDPMDLPPAHLRVGESMTARVRCRVNDAPARGWLFFVRNPDERKSAVLQARAWDQSLSELIFWHDRNPFELPTGFTGDLPGFPAKTRNLPGMITALLLVEPTNSTAVADLLGKPDPQWKPPAAPSFESFAHLITCAQRLFQRGNSKKLGTEKGDLPYGPPKLFIRPYNVME